MTKTYYTWDRLSDNVLMESDENGDTIATYSHEPRQYGRLLSQRRDGIASNYHFDAMGNTRAITQNGNVTDRYTFSAFGKEVARTGSTVNPWGYQGAVGYYANPDTEDLYVRARHYRPSIGRWLSTDPLGIAGGGANLYEYGRSNPLNHVDPSGENPIFYCLHKAIQVTCSVCVPAAAGTIEFELWGQGLDPTDSAKGGRAFLHCYAVCRSLKVCGRCLPYWQAREQPLDTVPRRMGYHNNEKGNECTSVGVSENCWDCCMGKWKNGDLKCQVGRPPYQLVDCPPPPPRPRPPFRFPIIQPLEP